MACSENGQQNLSRGWTWKASFSSELWSMSQRQSSDIPVAPSSLQQEEKIAFNFSDLVQNEILNPVS